MAEEIKEEKEETKKEEKKKIDIKELFNKNKKLAIGIIAGIVALIIIIILVVSLTGNKDEKHLKANKLDIGKRISDSRDDMK